MSTKTQLPEGDLSAPATIGQLLLVQSELGSKIDGVRSDVRLEMRDVRLGMSRTIWLAVATLGAIGILLQYF